MTRMGMTRMSGMQALFAEPSLFPLGADVDGDRFLFARVDAAGLRDLAFHDPRTIQPSDADRITVEAAPLLDAAVAWPRVQRVIFHTAFCASTLLSRALDRLAGVHGWREPYILLQIAETEPAAWRSPEARAAWTNLVLVLLNRGGALGGVVIKAHDRVLSEAHGMLGRYPDMRALALHTDLDSFVLGCLKSEQRRDWTIQSAAAAARRADSDDTIGKEIAAVFSTRRSEHVSDHAAFLWLYRIASIAAAVRHFGPDRLRPFDGGRFVEARREMLPSITQILDLPAPTSALFEDSVWGVHAKSSNIAMDSAAHAARQRQLAVLYSEDLGRARRCFEDLLGATPDLSPDIQLRNGRLVFDPSNLI